MRQSGVGAYPFYVLGPFLGMLLGLVGAFLVPVEPLPHVSAGVVLAVAGNFAVTYQLGVAAGSVVGAILPATMWLVTVVYFGTQRSEGDLVVTNTAAGLAFLLLGTVSAAVGIMSVRPGLVRAARRAAAREAARQAAREAEQSAAQDAAREAERDPARAAGQDAARAAEQDAARGAGPAAEQAAE